MGLVAAMTVPGLVNMMRGRHLTSAANRVHAILNGAKNIAVTQRKPYGVVFDISEGSMGVYEDGDDSNPLQGKVIFLPKSVSFSSLPLNDKVVFKPDGSLSTSARVIGLVGGQEHIIIRVLPNTGQVIIE